MPPKPVSGAAPLRSVPPRPASPTKKTVPGRPGPGSVTSVSGQRPAVATRTAKRPTPAGSVAARHPVTHSRRPAPPFAGQRSAAGSVHHYATVPRGSITGAHSTVTTRHRPVTTGRRPVTTEHRTDHRTVTTGRRPVAPGRKPVGGWAYRKGIHRAPGVPGVNVTNYYTASGSPIQPGAAPAGQPAAGQPIGFRGMGSRFEPATYRSSIPVSQPVYTGTTPGCPPVSPTTSRPACHTCGSGRKGCTTLSRFAFNSAQLKPAHKAQLRQLATHILGQKINAVIATGHADSSGTEDYNEALGAKRASVVIKELRKQLAMLSPGSQKTLFWKIDSKGETRPVSDTDAAANRRVAICLRKASFNR